MGLTTSASFTFNCPIDDLALSSMTADTLAGTDKQRDVAKHIHIAVTGVATCSNGHTWQVEPGSMLILERKG
jgi:hypothetical protein